MSKNISFCTVCARGALYRYKSDTTSLSLWPTFLKSSSQLSSSVDKRFYVTTSDFTSSPVSDAPKSLDVSPLSAEEEAKIVAKRAQQKIRRNIRLSEQYLDDPWHLGQHVERVLANDRFDEAYQLVQNASRQKQVEVSWNHLIEYQLRKDQVKTAFKIYNDVRSSYPRERAICSSLSRPPTNYMCV